MAHLMAHLTSNDLKKTNFERRRGQLEENDMELSNNGDRL